MAEPANPIEEQCIAQGLRMTGQRRVIARVLAESDDHPDVEELHRRANAIDPKISISTLYRTMRLLEEAGILAKRDFGDGRARYEQSSGEHHGHLIDLRNGEVVEPHPGPGLRGRPGQRGNGVDGASGHDRLLD